MSANLGLRTDRVSSELTSIEDIIRSGSFYNIPRYQRLYVWTDEQINTLLEDIAKACRQQRPTFFLGSILTVRSSPEQFDLIDGQQRFTTLWLVCLALGGELDGFNRVGDVLRLRFAIRKDVEAYFQAMLAGDDWQPTGERRPGGLTRIDNARRLIRLGLAAIQKKEGIGADALRDYIYRQVRFIVTEVPADTELNKLFEVINNRGIQLQHHEILKAKILAPIRNKTERIRFGKIWNICAEMSSYVERNLNDEVGKNMVWCFNRHARTFSFDALFDELGAEDRNIASLQLSAIMGGRKAREAPEERGSRIDENPNRNEDELQDVRSILTFPQLLLHTLRIFNYHYELDDIPQINEKELLRTFAPFLKALDADRARYFLKLLFDVRVQFDKHIIKWVRIGPNTEVHLIKELAARNAKKGGKYYYFTRVSNNGQNAFTMLQGMLYHSQQKTTQHWLTPLLCFLLENENREEALRFLQRLDNAMFCTGDTDELMPRSRKYLDGIETGGLRTMNISDLDEPSGTGFWHYWFYKLEFVLWLTERDKHKHWSDFRIVSKNSIEHVSPQKKKPEDMNAVSGPVLNTFGNLALVSTSFNSANSNNIFTVKQQQFIATRDYERPESLKLDLIYGHPEWNDEACRAHSEQMIQVLHNYIKKFL